ncbi:MAG: LEA14-like dessication related protein [Paracoccaceae bacterium]
MKRFLVLGFFFVLFGCASVDDAKPPSIQLSNLRLGNGGLLNQELLIEIRVGNPNNFELPLTGLTFELEVNGQPFADGLSDATVTVPRLGYATVPVTGNTNILSVFRQLMFLGKTDRITYRLHGIAYVGRLGINQSVPYERKGELSLQDAMPGLRDQRDLPGDGARPGDSGSGGVRTLAPVGL